MGSEATWVIAGALIGGFFAIVGGIVGGFVQGWAWYRFERKRARAEKRERWYRTAVEWDTTGHSTSLRRAILTNCDLRGVVLGSTEENPMAADLSFSDLSGANLTKASLRQSDCMAANLRDAQLMLADLSQTHLHEADLSGASLIGANLRGSNLHLAKLTGAYLFLADLTDAVLLGANLAMADLKEAKLHGARYSVKTTWPEGFAPTPEMILVDWDELPVSGGTDKPSAKARKS